MFSENKPFLLVVVDTTFTIFRMFLVGFGDQALHICTRRDHQLFDLVSVVNAHQLARLRLFLLLPLVNSDQHPRTHLEEIVSLVSAFKFARHAAPDDLPQACENTDPITEYFVYNCVEFIRTFGLAQNRALIIVLELAPLFFRVSTTRCVFHHVFIL